MNRPIRHVDTPWTLDNYKAGLAMTKSVSNKDKALFEEIVDDRIEKLPVKNLQKFFSSLRNKEFKLLPFRVHGLAKDNAEFQMFSNYDIRMHSFTLYSKHAYMTMFVFEMSDTRVQKEPFVQIALERFYSNKKGYGTKMLKHIVKKAEQSGVILTVWNENEKLKDYYVSHDFDYQYRSITTGHYFLTYNLK